MHPVRSTPVSKRTLLLGPLGALFLGAIACQAPASLDRGPRRAREEASAIERRNFDVSHYAIDLVLFPQRRSIEANCRVEFRPVGGDVDSIRLDLLGLEVKGVQDEDGNSLDFDHVGDALTVRFGSALLAGEPAEVTIAYGGRPITGMWFSGVGADGDSPSQVFTQGQAEDNRGWFPCLDQPYERATSEVRVTMPADWIGVLPGERVDVTREGATRTEHWRMDVEHPSYLVSVVAGEFISIDGEWDGVPLQFVVEPQYREWVEASFHETDEILTFLSDYTGVRYPYPKYSQVCVANFPWGGMENISATTLTPLTLGDARRTRDAQSTGLVAHEAAHQWFGDLFTCADWSHIWLNEGFATYMTLLYFEETRGLDEFRIRLRDAQDAAIEEDRGPGRRPTVWGTYEDPEDLMNTHVYEGAAVRLHLLRCMLGDEVFRAGVRTYAAENVGRSVVTTDFKRAMEKASGRDLSLFFDQWIYGRGTPEFELGWRWDERNEKVVLEVRQVQASGDGTPSAFRLSVDVQVQDEGGSVVHRVELTRRAHTFEFPVAGKPLYVRFDEGGQIPKTVVWKERKVAEWLAIAHEDPDVNGRRDAMKNLGRLAAEESKRGRLDTLETIVAELVHRLKRDASPSVRAAAATALGQCQGLEARERLMVAAKEDESAAVRASALSALATFPPAPELAGFATAAFAEGYSWNTMAAAAELYVHAAPREAYAWLTEKLFVDSPHDVLRAALLEDLGGLENDGVIAQLRRWANDDSTDPTARAVALRQLGLQPREQLQNSRFIAEFLGTEDFRLRAAAVETLGAVGDEHARRALRAYYPTAKTSGERRVIEAVLSRPGF